MTLPLSATLGGMFSTTLFSILNTGRLLSLSASLSVAAAGLTGAAWMMPVESPKTASQIANPVGSQARAQELIKTLALKPLPKESGLLGIVGVSAQKATVGGVSLAVQSQNYYMLTNEMPTNYLHWLAPDDTHVLIEGGPVDYYIFHPDGHAERLTLGTDVANGELPLIAVPGNCWKALKLHAGAKYALMANALSPEFTPGRVKIGANANWVRRFTNSASWATPEMLKDLIGPNQEP